jgi:ribonuclease BN (tRNA processing enzyme)
VREKRANTSVSLVVRDESKDEIIWHALVDVGLGVVDSLCDEFPPSQARLDLLLLTHWHPDHTLNLNSLCETLKRSKGQERIKMWCRSGSAEHLRKTHPFEWKHCLDVTESGEYDPPGIKLPPIESNRFNFSNFPLVVTPVRVSHSTADKEKPSSASFVIQWKDTKIVLLWDIDNGNNWIENPGNEQKETVEFLSRADYLFIDCNTWSVEEVNGKNTGHASFQTVKRYARVLNPKQTVLVHLSGHEDRCGNPGYGWVDGRWQAEANKAWENEKLPGNVIVNKDLILEF